jgi:hypothetical protein
MSGSKNFSCGLNVIYGSEEGWTIERSIRELISNLDDALVAGITQDEQIQYKLMKEGEDIRNYSIYVKKDNTVNRLVGEIKYESSNLVLINYGRAIEEKYLLEVGLPGRGFEGNMKRWRSSRSDWIVNGVATEKYFIGRFGEGLKRAICCLLRLETEIHIETDEYLYIPKRTEEQSVYFERIKNPLSRIMPSSYTKITLFSVEASDVPWWRFLFLSKSLKHIPILIKKNKSKNSHSESWGQILLDDIQQNHVYVNNVYVSSVGNLPFGLNLDNYSYFLKKNRNVIPHSALELLDFIINYNDGNLYNMSEFDFSDQFLEWLYEQLETRHHLFVKKFSNKMLTEYIDDYTSDIRTSLYAYMCEQQFNRPYFFPLPFSNNKDMLANDRKLFLGCTKEGVYSIEIVSDLLYNFLFEVVRERMKKISSPVWDVIIKKKTKKYEDARFKDAEQFLQDLTPGASSQLYLVDIATAFPELVKDDTISDDLRYVCYYNETLKELYLDVKLLNHSSVNHRLLSFSYDSNLEVACSESCPCLYICLVHAVLGEKSDEFLTSFLLTRNGKKKHVSNRNEEEEEEEEEENKSSSSSSSLSEEKKQEAEIIPVIPSNSSSLSDWRAHFEQYFDTEQAEYARYSFLTSLQEIVNVAVRRSGNMLIEEGKKAMKQMAEVEKQLVTYKEDADVLSELTSHIQKRQKKAK